MGSRLGATCGWGCLYFVCLFRNVRIISDGLMPPCLCLQATHVHMSIHYRHLDRWHMLVAFVHSSPIASQPGSYPVLRVVAPIAFMCKFLCAWHPQLKCGIHSRRAWRIRVGGGWWEACHACHYTCLGLQLFVSKVPHGLVGFFYMTTRLRLLPWYPSHTHTTFLAFLASSTFTHNFVGFLGTSTISSFLLPAHNFVGFLTTHT